MRFAKSDNYNRQFICDNLMGPSSLKILEELTEELDLHPGMKALDLGCGRGLTSIFLAKEFGVQVYAVDLWTNATDNYARFKEMGTDDLIVPIHADATNLPFAEQYFDVIISIDAYHYFGSNASVMDNKIAPYAKSGALIALAFPGLKEEFQGKIPPELLLSWNAEDLETFHSCKWWKSLFAKAEKVRVHSIEEMECFEDSWNDWLNSGNAYAAVDKKSMDAGAGRYMNIVSAILQRNEP